MNNGPFLKYEVKLEYLSLDLEFCICDLDFGAGTSLEIIQVAQDLK